MIPEIQERITKLEQALDDLRRYAADAHDNITELRQQLEVSRRIKANPETPLSPAPPQVNRVPEDVRRRTF